MVLTLTRLDYEECCTGWPTNIPCSATTSIQSVLNAAARVIFHLWSADHITGCAFSERIEDKIALLTFRIRVLHRSARQKSWSRRLWLRGISVLLVRYSSRSSRNVPGRAFITQSHAGNVGRQQKSSVGVTAPDDVAPPDLRRHRMLSRRAAWSTTLNDARTSAFSTLSQFATKRRPSRTG